MNKDNWERKLVKYWSGMNYSLVQVQPRKIIGAKMRVFVHNVLSIPGQKRLLEGR